jgi:hypothetical protein
MADYTYDSRRGSGNSGLPGYWWEQGDGITKTHDRVFDTVRFLDKEQAYKSRDTLRNVRLYGSLPVYGLSPSAFATTDPTKKKRIKVNVVRMVVDTAVAHVAKERPRPSPMTDGANYRLQKQARDLGKFVLGVFQANKVYEHGPAVFRDGALLRAGFFKACIADSGKNIEIERCFIDELLWDDAEAYDGNLYQLHHRKFVPRHVALKLWPKHAKAIQEAPEPPTRDGALAYKNLADHIEVIESWKLPTGDDCCDGCHCICIPTATLLCEEWSHSWFPIAWFRWSEPVRGLFGDGIGDMLTGLQVSINKHLEVIEQSLDYASIPRVFVEENSEVVSAHINNLVGAVVKYSGSQPPLFSTPQGVIGQDRWQFLLWEIQSAFDQAGVAQMQATGELPPGLNQSGKAIREYSEQVAERFSVVQRSYEDMYVQLARIVIGLGRDIYAAKSGKSLDAKVRGRRFIERVKFADINIEDDQYELQIWPTSMLPKTPSARYQQIDEWVQAGYLSKEEGMRLMDMPDLDDAVSLITAAIDDIDQAIDDMLYRDPDELAESELNDMDDDERETAVADMVYEPPEITQALELGKKRMLAAYLRGKRSGVPQARLGLLLQWIADADALLKQGSQSVFQTISGSGQPQMPPGAPQVAPQLVPAGVPPIPGMAA